MALSLRALTSAAAFGVAVAAIMPAASLSATPPIDHAQHHASASANSLSPKNNAVAAMSYMQAMHEKLMAAKTPAERRALMGEHMKAMREGMMAMQQEMGPCCSGKESAAMTMRMDMMTMMMQMMMDQQSIAAGATASSGTESPSAPLQRAAPPTPKTPNP